MNRLLMVAVVSGMKLRQARKHNRLARSNEPSAMLLEPQRIAEECSEVTEQANAMLTLDDHVKALLDAHHTGQDIDDLQAKLDAFLAER